MKKSMRFLLLLLLPILLISCSKDGKDGPLGPSGERGIDGGDGGTIIITNNNYYTNAGPSGSTNTIQIRHTLVFDILMNGPANGHGLTNNANIKAESEVELYCEIMPGVWRCVNDVYASVQDTQVNLDGYGYDHTGELIKTVLTWWEEIDVIVP